MKRLQTYFFSGLVLMVLMAFTHALDNQKTLFDEIKLVAIKNPKQVRIILTSAHFSEMDEIIVERSTESNGFYRQIKILYKEDIQKSTEDKLEVFDNYPLSVQSAGYYRVRIKLSGGVSRTYPGVQEISYDNFNALRHVSNAPKTITAKRTNEKENVEEVIELQSNENEAIPVIRDEQTARMFESSMKATKFSIQRQSEFERKISIELPTIDKLENIYVMMNNIQDQSYYTIKEFDREQITANNIKGKLEYTFKLEAGAKPGTTYSIKLRLTSEIYHYETASQQFN